MPFGEPRDFVDRREPPLASVGQAADARVLIAGGSDHVVPALIDNATSRRFQRKSTAVTDYKESPDRSHFTVGQQGWEEVADYALDWAVEHARTAAPG